MPSLVERLHEAADLARRDRLEFMASLLLEAAAEIERLEIQDRHDYKPLIRPGSWLRDVRDVATPETDPAQ
jgi:hypothetical protein